MINITAEQCDISAKAFKNIQALIYKIAGISLSDAKKTLVTGRLNKRLRVLKLANFDDYYDFLLSNEVNTSNGINNNDELQTFVDLLTTNETYFFREQMHFDFLVNTILPSFKNNQPLALWSAASSSGEEAYTLAMLLAEHLGINGNWRILGTDISATILADARRAIYNEQRVRLVPAHYRHKYLLQGTGSQQGNVAVVPELKKHVRFESFNLVDGVINSDKFDVIFCRNVLIYFDHHTKDKVVNRLCRNLKAGGYFISGRSESLHSLSHGLNTVKPSIYQQGLKQGKNKIRTASHG
ncbi:MAG: SAM-dependent methyltransferase [Gammaproteobacteria bacterium]|nr:MAG: SAM-dependent methyltransferase [Gammaproteobacteria bacterium]